MIVAAVGNGVVGVGVDTEKGIRKEQGEIHKI